MNIRIFVIGASIAALGLAGLANGATIVGKQTADVLHGTKAADTMRGRGGNDRLYGGRGNDRLYGQGGDDHLYGQRGKDVLSGGRGSDRLYGGLGRDTIKALDGEVDFVSCGPGKDRVTADVDDDVAADCEQVLRPDAPSTPPSTPPAPPAPPAPPSTHAFLLTVEVGGPGTVTSVPTGIQCPGICSAEYAEGTTVTLTARTIGRVHFTGWTGACSGVAACTVTVDSAKSVKATFTSAPLPTYTLSVTVVGNGHVTSVPSGIDCYPTTSDCKQTFTAGTVVKLTAEADTGWRLASWLGGGCAVVADSCSVTMNSNKGVGFAFVAA